MLSQSTKTLSLTLFAAAFAFMFTACDDDSSTGPDPNESQLETYTVEDLMAQPDSTNDVKTSTYTFYNLRENEIVATSDSASSNWDIALSTTTIGSIRFNSGSSGPGDASAVLLDVPFEDVTEAPTEGLKVDSEEQLAIPSEDEEGWYNYTSNETEPFHAILPIEGKTIVLKTADGDYYAKIRIISYYEGNPDISTEEFANFQRPPSPYYTFEYAIQLNGTTELN